MHEASLLANFMRRLDEIAVAEHAQRVVGVSVRLGALSHFSAEDFAEHFERAAAGTIADGARLTVAVSDDLEDPGAQDVMLEKIEVEI